MDLLRTVLFSLLALSLLASTVLSLPLDTEEEDPEFRLQSVLDEALDGFRQKREVDDPTPLLTRLRRSMAQMYLGSRYHHSSVPNRDRSRYRHRSHRYRHRQYGGGQISDA